MDPAIKGWEVESVAREYERKWPSFVQALTGARPLGIAHESPEIANTDFWAHNTLVSYAYVLALTARKKDEVSILDWGGAMGHYYLVSRAVLPGVKITYHCRDLPLFASRARRLLPDVRFYDDDACLGRAYDLVFASGSLQYAEDWRELLRKLADASRTSLYVTRLPVVLRSGSFVVVQRAYAYQYETEYLGWALNREELLDAASATGMTLRREFLLSAGPNHVHGAPEATHERGFLFQRDDSRPTVVAHA